MFYHKDYLWVYRCSTETPTLFAYLLLFFGCSFILFTECTSCILSGRYDVIGAYTLWRHRQHTLVTSAVITGGRWGGSGGDFAGSHVFPLDGVSFVNRWQHGFDSRPAPVERHRAPELLAGLVVVEGLLAHRSVVVVVVQTLERSLALHGTRVFFNGNFASVHVGFFLGDFETRFCSRMNG